MNLVYGMVIVVEIYNVQHKQQLQMIVIVLIILIVQEIVNKK